MGKYYFYNESPNEYSFMDEDLGLTTDNSNFDQNDFYNKLEELQEPADPSMMDGDSICFLHAVANITKVEFLSSYVMLLPNVMKKCSPPTQT
jgi:hypothetical protein